jgi:hypothetical protein
MIEEKARLIIRSGRHHDTSIAGGEPSHIHLPRRRRLVRPDDAGSRAPRDAEQGRGQVQAAPSHA